MDLKQAILAILALVASTYGFIPQRQLRQRLRPRSQQLSLQHSVTSRGNNPALHGLLNGINQRLRMRTAPRSSNAINIIANIILHRGQNNNRVNGPNRNTGHGTGRNQGRGSGTAQGQGYPEQTRHGQINHGQRRHRTGPLPNQGYNLISGHGQAQASPNLHTGSINSHGSHTLQSALGSLLGQGTGRADGSQRSGGTTRGVFGQTGNVAASLQSTGLRQLNSTGPNLGHSNSIPSLSGIGNQAVNPSVATGTVSPLKSHIVIFPNGPNSQTFVLSAGRGVGIQPVKTNSGQGAILITRDGQAASSQPNGMGFNTITTLKPGEDPPEFEQM